MALLSLILTAFVAFEHAGFMWLEMFMWTKPMGLKTFGRTLEQAKDSAILAANQGLYNGFLSAGLIWSLVAPAGIAVPVRLFFLACVVIAGIYGGMTAKRSILFVQALPAAIALVATLL